MSPAPLDELTVQKMRLSASEGRAAPFHFFFRPLPKSKGRPPSRLGKTNPIKLASLNGAFQFCRLPASAQPVSLACLMICWDTLTNRNSGKPMTVSLCRRKAIITRTLRTISYRQPFSWDLRRMSKSRRTKRRPSPRSMRLHKQEWGSEEDDVLPEPLPSDDKLPRTVFAVPDWHWGFDALGREDHPGICTASRPATMQATLVK